MWLHWMFSFVKRQPIFKFETLIRWIESVRDNDFQLCRAENWVTSPDQTKLHYHVAACQLFSLRDLFWQDVFWEVSIALVHPVALCERWINGHVRRSWCRREENDQLGTFSLRVSTSFASQLHLGLCKQSCLDYYHLRISWRYGKTCKSKKSCG